MAKLNKYISSKNGLIVNSCKYVLDEISATAYQSEDLEMNGASMHWLNFPTF